MSIAGYFALVFTVALLVSTAYFLMGGLPLLVLKHDVPLDARFVGSFFTVNYRAAFWTSLGAGISYAVWGLYAFAFGAGVIAAVTTLLRRRLLPAMQDIGARIGGLDGAAIARFRRLHTAALCGNLVQLVVVVWGVLQLSRQLS